MVELSREQYQMVDLAMGGTDVIVNAVPGSGKTTAIQELCTLAGEDRSVLYLTYSRLLKADAQRRVKGAKVQNYHGIVYPYIRRLGIKCGVSESIAMFNRHFVEIKPDFPAYDMIVIDEYQDITEEYALLLENIKSLNPSMTVVMVGDMEQKVNSNTRLDVDKFAKQFCTNPAMVYFTQSFRLGSDLCDRLGLAWSKTIIGSNKEQKIAYADYDTALKFALHKKPGEILCLGKRQGQLTRMLNELEDRNPAVYNKNTIYASIRDGDGKRNYDDNTAIFTTYDSSKGLERPYAIVFDYDVEYWRLRNRFPNVEPAVMRNVFLVAASRGKSGVIFVGSPSGLTRSLEPDSDDQVGFIKNRMFREATKQQKTVYDKPLEPSSMFDFKYVENVIECYDLLERTPVREPGETIEVDRQDGLIDLSPVVGQYQELMYFSGVTANRVIASMGSETIDPMMMHWFKDLDKGNPWRDALVLTAVSTSHERYARQVGKGVSRETTLALGDRIATLLHPDVLVQLPVSMAGRLSNETYSSPIQFNGLIDAVDDSGVVYELKYVSELSREMFLQLGMYLVMSGREVGRLWNTRTDECWEVRVSDDIAFMDAVARCVSKEEYTAFN